jgi:hypothetical protein
MASEFRPGGPAKSTEQTPIFLYKGGNHVPDFGLENTAEGQRVLKAEVEVMRKWLAAWSPSST